MLLAGLLVGCGGSRNPFQISDSPMFRNNDLGCSRDQLQETELLTQEKTLGDSTLLFYQDATVDGMDADIVYSFDASGAFESGIIYYRPDSDLDTRYGELVSKCNELYGEVHLLATEDSITWKLPDRYVVVLNRKQKLIYNVCTIENFEGTSN